MYRWVEVCAYGWMGVPMGGWVYRWVDVPELGHGKPGAVSRVRTMNEGTGAHTATKKAASRSPCCLIDPDRWSLNGSAVSGRPVIRCSSHRYSSVFGYDQLCLRLRQPMSSPSCGCEAYVVPVESSVFRDVPLLCGRHPLRHVSLSSLNHPRTSGDSPVIVDSAL